MPYAVAEAREKFRMASENPDKIAVARADSSKGMPANRR